MKKIFTVLAAASFMAQASAQVLLSEDFSSYSAGGNVSSSGATGPDGVDIYGGKSVPKGLPSTNFPLGAKVYQAGGMAKLGAASGAGSMSTKALQIDGDFTVSFEVKGWTEPGTIVVTTSSGQSQEVPYTALMSGSTEKKTITFTGGSNSEVITLATKIPTPRAYLDNVVISKNTILAAADFGKYAKQNLLKNTVVSADLYFAQSADVHIYDFSGKLVKSAKVDTVNPLNVADLPKGTYIARANGATEKFIKN